MIVVSGFFGFKPTSCHQAPNESCYFFSNNQAMETIVKNKGWKFVFCPEFPISNEPRVSSLQSKWFKFLQFDFENLFPDVPILYVDHKFNLRPDHIEFVKKTCNRPILIRNSPKVLNSIEEEVEVLAKREKRYAEVLGETMKWVDMMEKKFGFSRKVRMVNTGLIYYRSPREAKPLCDDVYKTCWFLGQPECQIVWNVLAQNNLGIVQTVEWSELNPDRSKSFLW